MQPRKGFIRDLNSLSEYGPTISMVLFSGPHGKAVCINGYENILLVATGFGIAALLLYLKKLVHEYNSRKVSIYRIHLV